jgi:hypothetical protein
MCKRHMSFDVCVCVCVFAVYARVHSLTQAASLSGNLRHGADNSWTSWYGQDDCELARPDDDLKRRCGSLLLCVDVASHPAFHMHSLAPLRFLRHATSLCHSMLLCVTLLHIAYFTCTLLHHRASCTMPPFFSTLCCLTDSPHASCRPASPRILTCVLNGEKVACH